MFWFGERGLGSTLTSLILTSPEPHPTTYEASIWSPLSPLRMMKPSESKLVTAANIFPEVKYLQ